MLTTNTDFLYPELMDVVRLFGDEQPDIRHEFVSVGDRFLDTVEIGGHVDHYEERMVFSGDLEFRRYAKRFSKIAVYESLRRVTGRSMPWGALTGIRPTKLAYAEIAAGRDFRVLFKKCGASSENIALIADVLHAQEGIYAHTEGAADLYIGIPFCPSKCEYCSFITADIGRTGRYVDAYLDALEKEISACRGLFGKLNSVYIGGGTPLVLEPAQLRRVLDAAAPFAEGVEYTVEAGRPGVFTEEKLDLLRDYGVTRICVNPQTFCDETLVRIGRRHTAADVYRAYEMARRYPFAVNLDLIAGLTGESVDDFCASVDAAIALAPENITVHTLCLKKGARLKEEETRLCGAGLPEMIAHSRRALYEAGYQPYYLYRQKYMAGNCENTGWTKPGRACVYNVDVMEEITDNIAFGANAVGKKLFAAEARIERLGSPKDIPTYIGKIDEIIARKQKLYGRISLQ